MSNLCILVLLYLSHYQSLCVEGEGKLCIESIIGNGSLKPLFTCWFTTYVNETRYRNAVMGYDNTFTSLVRTIQSDVDNYLSLDGLVDVTAAPKTFLPGLYPLVFVIPMVSVVDWLLDVTQLSVTLATLDDSTMCYHLYNQTCGGGVSSFAHFCEDDSFCNGEEVCALHNNSCISNTSACIDKACSEDPPRCMPTLSPTVTPTIQPTAIPIIQPTSQPTTIPTDLPTLTPTMQPTSLLTSQPTTEPTQTPTGLPTNQPTLAPTTLSTNQPTFLPTVQPTNIPTIQPTTCPTAVSSCFIYRPVIYAK